MKRSGLSNLPFKFIAFAIAIIALCLAPQTALAQHGGGHAGGGGHFGGGGGHFGGHTAGYTGGHSHSSHVTAPSHTTNGPSSATLNAARRPAGAPFPLSWGAGLNRPSVIGGMSAGQGGKGITEFSPAPAHTTIGFPPVAGGATTFPNTVLRSAPLSFSGQGHEIWQDAVQPAPPTGHAQLPSLVMRPQPPHIIRPLPPGFFPGAYGPAFGFFGFTPLLGFGWGCDPFDPVWGFDCGPGYGYGYGPAYGYGFGGYYPPASDYGAPPPEEQPSDEDSYDINAHNSWQNPPSSESNSESNVAAPHSVIYLQDGTSYEVGDYWVAGNKLHYVTNYGGENSVDVSRVDIQRTVDANASRGLTFTLHPAENRDLTPPPSTDNAPPEPAAPPAPAAPPSPDAPPAPPQP